MANKLDKLGNMVGTFTPASTPTDRLKDKFSNNTTQEQGKEKSPQTDAGQGVTTTNTIAAAQASVLRKPGRPQKAPAERQQGHRVNVTVPLPIYEILDSIALASNKSKSEILVTSFQDWLNTDQAKELLEKGLAMQAVLNK